MRAQRYSNDIKSLKDDCLHWKDALNIVAIPPPFLFVRVALIQLKLGGADSIRVGALLTWSNHVSVKSKKSKLCEQIRSLIKKDLFKRDLIFSRASLTVRVGTFCSLDLLPR